MPKKNNNLFADVSDGRRRIMRAIKSTGTVPEQSLRAALHRLGYRFRKNSKLLPGKPDIAFTARKRAIFVHGCFWHAHASCEHYSMPRTRTEYWSEKLQNNVKRDERNTLALLEGGWGVEVVWECELSDMQHVIERLVAFLGPPSFKKEGIVLTNGKNSP